MSSVRKVIHNPLSAAVHTLEGDRLIEFLQIQQFDQILAHQYCVRRFLLKHPGHYHALRTLRADIEAVLADTPLSNENRLFIGRRITATARAMRVLDSRQVRELGNAGERMQIQRILESEMEPEEDKLSLHPILGYLSEAQIHALTDIVGHGAKIVETIHQELNFLDYYDPFSLTNLVRGKTMLAHYPSAKGGRSSVHPRARNLSREHHWLHTEEAELDDELTGLVCEHGFNLKRPPSNVQIFGHTQHRITVDGIDLPNHLILAVPTDRTPVNIDAALRELRSVLRQAFIDMCGCYANVSAPEFDNSLFMSQFEEHVFLITEVKQFRNRLQGLWLWDRVNPSDNTPALTVSKTIDTVMSEAEQQLNDLAPDEVAYKSDSYKNYYDQAVRQIGPKQNKGDLRTPRHLDRFLTMSDRIIGMRQQ